MKKSIDYSKYKQTESPPASPPIGSSSEEAIPRKETGVSDLLVGDSIRDDKEFLTMAVAKQVDRIIA